MPDKLSVGVGGGNAQRTEGRRPQGIDLGMFGRQPEYAPEAQGNEQEQQGKHHGESGVSVIAGGLCILMMGEIGKIGKRKKFHGQIGEHPAAVAEKRGLLRQDHASLERVIRLPKVKTSRIDVRLPAPFVRSSTT